MFKISNLKDINNEKINIDFVNHQSHNFNTKETNKFKTLSFDISGTINNDKYSFSFDLNCKPKDLLKIKENENIDFKQYIFESETYFTLNGVAFMEPIYDIKICRYLKNKFIVKICFYSEDYSYNNDIYSGMIEFEFNLNDYLGEDTYE